MNESAGPLDTAGCEIPEWRELNRAMIERLTETGILDDNRWREAFENVPRHAFVPRFIRRSQIIDCADPKTSKQWRDSVYTDTSLIVQTAPAPNYDSELPTSSSTLPSLMARMLGLLQVDDGDTVLEIGTATGYNAAVLCSALGDDHVTTIELHPDLSALARHRFATLGMNVTAVTGDGAAGYLPNAPYSRILATCAADKIPAAWIQQLEPGGRIVVDLRAEMSSSLAVLDKVGSDRVEGRLVDFPGYFMWLRPDPDSPLLHPDAGGIVVYHDDDHVSTTDHDPTLLANAGLRVAVSILEPTLRAPLSLTDDIDDGSDDYFFYADDGSWARATRMADGRYSVTQGGPRRVWQSIEIAMDRWRAAGQPGRGDYVLTVTADGTHCYGVAGTVGSLYSTGPA